MVGNQGAKPVRSAPALPNHLIMAYRDKSLTATEQ